MMREYLELFLEMPIEEYGEMVLSWVMTSRYEVTGFSDADKQASVSDLLELAGDLSAQVQLHQCFHEEDPNKPCSTQIVATKP